MLISERQATSVEKKKWDEVLRLAEQLKRYTYANVLRDENFKLISVFSARYGVQIPLMTADEIKRLNRNIEAFKRIYKAIQAVERLELGIYFAEDDVVIVAPSWYTSDQIASYQLSGWPFVLIAAGVAIVAGVIGYIHRLQSDNEELSSRYDAVLQASEKRICSDPTSAACQAWKKEKEPKAIKENEGIIASLTSGIAEIGQTAKKGLGIGLALAIPLLAWSYLGRRKS
jgi:hypothetical protein